MKEQLSKSIYGLMQKDAQKTEKGTLIKRGYFTSDNRDEVGDIITRSATERAIPKYRQWGNLRFMHQPKPVAKMLKIGTEDGLDWNEIEFEVIDPETAFMVENGLLTALSVGILVNFEDIDFLEDGGFIINDYQLAEISLVDHPANYDAKLKDLELNQEDRMFALQYGLTALKDHIGGLNMPKKSLEIETEASVEEETTETEEVTETEVEKDLETETTEEVVEETKDLDEESTEGADETDPVEEEKDITEEPVEEETVEKEADETNEKDALISAVSELTNVTRSLATLLEELIRSRETTESESDGAEDEKTLEVTETEEEETEEETEPTEVAERKGSIPTVESDITGKEVLEQVEKTIDLRQDRKSVV